MPTENALDKCYSARLLSYVLASDWGILARNTGGFIAGVSNGLAIFVERVDHRY